MNKQGAITSTALNSKNLITARPNKVKGKEQALIPRSFIPDGDLVSKEDVEKALKDLPILDVLKSEILQKDVKKLVGRFVTQDASIGEVMAFETVQSIAMCNNLSQHLAAIVFGKVEGKTQPEGEYLVDAVDMINSLENTKLRMIQATVEIAEKLQALTTKKPPEEKPKNLPPVFAPHIVVNGVGNPNVKVDGLKSANPVSSETGP